MPNVEFKSDYADVMLPSRKSFAIFPSLLIRILTNSILT